MKHLFLLLLTITTSALTTEPKRNRTLAKTPRIPQSQSFTFVDDFQPLSERYITFSNYHSTALACTVYEYDNKNKRIAKNVHILNRMPVNVPVKTNGNTASAIIKLLLNTAPMHVCIAIGNSAIAFGDTLKIYDDVKTIRFDNLTQKTTLFNLPKEGSTLHIGNCSQTNDNTPTHKSMHFINVNIPSLTLHNIGYQEPVYEHGRPVPTSKLCCCYSETLREKQIAKEVKIFSQEDNTNIVRSALIIESFYGLQKIKIHPEDDVVKNNDILSIQFSGDQNYIRIINQYGTIIGSTPTRKCHFTYPKQRA